VSAAAIAVAAFTCLPVAAQADFGIDPGSATVTALGRDGTAVTQAGSHPYAFTVHFDLNADESGHVEGGEMRNVFVKLPPGFFGNPQAVPRCPRQLFEGYLPNCPPGTQVGFLRASITGLADTFGPIYNLAPPPGVVSEFGFSAVDLNSFQFASVRSDEGYGLGVSVPDAPVGISSVTTTFWGSPADKGHDSERTCILPNGGHFEGCSSDSAPSAFLTMPSSCEGAPEATIEVDSKDSPGVFTKETVPFSDPTGNPAPTSGCDGVPFAPKIASQPTTALASNPTGLDFELKLPNQGLLGPGAIAETEPKKTVVTLPEGVTVNPSFAEGIATCSQGQYKAEALDTPSGAGCPAASKIGSILVQTPLLEEPLEGSLYQAAPYENPFDTLAALYVVARAPERGILVKQAGKVEFDPNTGRITTTFDHLPPLPFSSFKLHFKEGPRAPLATPPACGQYQTLAELTPFSAKDDSEAITTTAAFQVEHGADGGPCPTGGLPPFKPALTAGSLNPIAGRFSPFNVKITRTDTEQEINHFSIKLPRGVAAKLAGVPFCSDAAIEAAISRTGSHGGAEELAAPSCPAATQVGRTLAGAGVGQVLAYAPGRVYLAGPYHGAPVSLVAITAAKVGPFDLGTVVVRLAIKVNPETGEVFLDATGSDPLPHIINGIPTHLRDVRAYTDRPQFTFNPTSCKPTSTSATLLGSGLDFTSPSDDNPFVSTSPFQVADCAALPFRPKLTLKLRGSTRRAGNPALQAHLAMAGFGESGLAYAQVALPKTLFLDNAHIGTLCTRVQFKEGVIEGEKCPAASVIGTARALTPVLDAPLEGPIYLRSNGGERQLPDIAASLHGSQISVVAVGYTDSAPGGGLRNTFEVIPDAPISSVDIDLFGGRKGLIESSRNLCSYMPRAAVKFKGHNGKRFDPTVRMKASGCTKKATKRHHRGAVPH
jgi:hypothetical protein